jgi:hypothetical protein
LSLLDGQFRGGIEWGARRTADGADDLIGGAVRFRTLKCGFGQTDCIFVCELLCKCMQLKVDGGKRKWKQDCCNTSHISGEVCPALSN